MIFVFLTVLVASTLAYAFFELRSVYGAATLTKLFCLTLGFFYLKEFLQAHDWLLHHYYHANHKVWIELAGVPPFIVFGHLFVVLMTWQLAAVRMQTLGLARHPAIMATIVWYFTGAFSMLMENTGVVGHWWTWTMGSWWYYPNFEGLPLRDLPWERPITTAWGYFISTFWFVLLAVDVAGKWTRARVAALGAGLLVLLELSRLTPFMAFWAFVVMPGLPFLSILCARAGRPLPFPENALLLTPRRLRWSGAVPAGLLAMAAVAVTQMAVASKWLGLVSLLPIVSFTLGSYGLQPVWVDCIVSAGVMALGARLVNGNLALAGWLVFRCSLVLSLSVLMLRWSVRRRSSFAGQSP